MLGGAHAHQWSGLVPMCHRGKEEAKYDALWNTCHSPQKPSGCTGPCIEAIYNCSDTNIHDTTLVAIFHLWKFIGSNLTYRTRLTSSGGWRTFCKYFFSTSSGVLPGEERGQNENESAHWRYNFYQWRESQSFTQDLRGHHNQNCTAFYCYMRLAHLLE